MATLFRTLPPRIPRRPPTLGSCSRPRQYETAGASYPFNPRAQLIPLPAQPVTDKLKRGVGLMEHLRHTLPTERTAKLLATLFNHHHSGRARPGSILHLTLKRAPFAFSGILMEVRHKGVDTSFVLRNVVHRTGVEMRFNVASDNLLDVKLARSADGKDMRRERRAKLFYLRENPAKMNAISQGAIRKQKKEERATRELEEMKAKGRGPKGKPVILPAGPPRR
ncbi:hypothetical protein CALVIDRAFT_436856 [Calocera viscosa TUFC12733]|uniref:Translation protein SH3-like protein n=1 Tax=Calocera viscosa (strain TUFC12733) TaxID=1330018 RepID=A0A167FV72_CALVF|nr:hypothetical protein CALVIDRAFT_436856 [Calocera viscosa TUFC12733]